MKSVSLLKKIGSLLVLILLLVSVKDVSCSLLVGQDPSMTDLVSQKVLVPTRRLKNLFKKGETIKFGIYSHKVKVGSGELFYGGLVRIGAEEFQYVTLKASTFSINDEEKVYGYSDFSSPYKVERHVRLFGFFGKNEKIVENYSKRDKRVIISKNSGRNRDDIVQTICSDKVLDNVLLLIYRLRGDKDMRVGKIYDVALPTQSFKLIVQDKRKVSVPLGIFETFYITSEPAKYKIWLSADESRLPVRIQGLVAAGMAYLAATDLSYQKI